MVARSIIEGVQEIGPLRVPMVVRLQGTRSAEGQQVVGYTFILCIPSFTNSLNSTAG